MQSHFFEAIFSVHVYSLLFLCRWFFLVAVEVSRFVPDNLSNKHVNKESSYLFKLPVVYVIGQIELSTYLRFLLLLLRVIRQCAQKHPQHNFEVRW